MPADVLRPRRADEHFAAEAATARDAGLQVALVDHDLLLAGDGAPGAVARVPESVDGCRAVYRGWMLPADRYAAFAAALTAHGVRLYTVGEQYRRAHELPGRDPALAALTSASVWIVGVDRDAFAQACGRLGPGARCSATTPSR